MTSAGVLAGANRPYQLSAAYPATPASATVGNVGNAGERSADVTAIARNWPASTSDAALATVVNITWIWPPIRSVMAGAAPLYGTAVRLTLAMSLNSSPARWAEVPTPNVP